MICLTLVDLWPLIVIHDQIWWCQSKAHGHFPVWLLLSPKPYLSPFGHKSPEWPLTTHPANQPTRHSYNVCRLQWVQYAIIMYCSLDLKLCKSVSYTCLCNFLSVKQCTFWFNFVLYYQNFCQFSKYFKVRR